jgi:hypothetical protein
MNKIPTNHNNCSRKQLSPKQVANLAEKLMSEACALDRLHQRERTVLNTIYDIGSDLQEHYRKQKIKND